MEFASLKTKFESLGQGHVFSHLTCEIRTDSNLLQQFSELDLDSSLDHFDSANSNSNISGAEQSQIAPITDILSLISIDNCNKRELDGIGIEAIRSGTVGALILSGGQGTRLGYAGPKGMYSIGPISQKTIFQLHVERVQKMRQLCKIDDNTLPSIPIYIMTSDLNDEAIRNYFKSQSFFGYPQDDIHFFRQGVEPCLTFDKKLILDSPDSLALSPDGNGGVFSALKKTNTLADMHRRGILHLHVYGIDNILTKAVDPVFLGSCIQQNAQCGNKVVVRVDKTEKVGLVVRRNDRMCVVEYSEVPTYLAEAQNEDGTLLLHAANICNHYFNVTFLAETLLPQLAGMYHKAVKKIPFFDPISASHVTPTQPNGVKLELFIFDAFLFADRWVVVETDRMEEFAPVKNECGNPVDSPDTARSLMSCQAKRWLRAAGAILSGDDEGHAMCELSPLLSYGGEGLEAFKGQTISLPRYLSLSDL